MAVLGKEKKVDILIEVLVGANLIMLLFVQIWVAVYLMNKVLGR